MTKSEEIAKTGRLITIKEFQELAAVKADFAREMFQNAALIRDEIIYKINEPNKNGGYRMDWGKFLKWASKNAKMLNPYINKL